MAVELLLAGCANLLYGAVFLAVGTGMRRRFNGRDLPFAAQAFVVWWHVMAGQAFTVSAMQLTAGMGAANLRLLWFLFVLSLVFASLQIWALGHYILHIWGTERHRVRIPLAVFTIAYFLYFFLLLGAPRPEGAVVGTWAAGIDSVAVPHVEFLATLFFLPFFTLLSAYFLAAFRTHSPTRKTRILVLATAAALWNVAQVGQFATARVGDTPFQGLLVVLNLGWALILYMTYYPPRPLKRVFGLMSLDDETQA